jgi:hypothetical protein
MQPLWGDGYEKEIHGEDHGTLQVAKLKKVRRIKFQIYLHSQNF